MIGHILYGSSSHYYIPLKPRPLNAEPAAVVQVVPRRHLTVSYLALSELRLAVLRRGGLPAVPVQLRDRGPPLPALHAGLDSQALRGVAVRRLLLLRVLARFATREVIFKPPVCLI